MFSCVRNVFCLFWVMSPTNFVAHFSNQKVNVCLNRLEFIKIAFCLNFPPCPPEMKNIKVRSKPYASY